jgi:alkaline phosphatase
MAKYVDGFVIPIPKKKIAEYKKLAQKSAGIWKEFGAIDYFECIGDDLKNNFGLSFPRLAKLKKGETVIFSWITYKSRKDRDRANAKVMKDPRIADMMKGPMPFDMKRMSYGGFQVIVESR